MSSNHSPVPYKGALTAVQTANAMRAARLNAVDLFDTAELLFNLKRFQHSLAFSVLALEESAKISYLLLLYIGPEADKAANWRSYRQHRAKTALLNEGMTARIRATMPDIPLEQAEKLGQMGPTPDQLESLKQRAIYSDCYVAGSEIVSHQPGLADLRKDAWERLCEAKALIFGLRDRPPDELEIWYRHATSAQAEGRGLRTMLPLLHNELNQKGLIEEGSWKAILSDLAEESGDPSTVSGM